MTPCYICSGGMEEPRLDPRDMKTRPCSRCEAIIAETAGLNDEDEDVWEPFDDEEFDEEDIDLA
jgi:hypothetical protein